MKYYYTVKYYLQVTLAMDKLFQDHKDLLIG